MTRPVDRWVVKAKIHGDWHEFQPMTSEVVARLAVKTCRSDGWPTRLERWTLVGVDVAGAGE